MPHQTVLIIRHAEKPIDDNVQGIDAAGALDGRSLTPRGWQRAGVWAEYFAPTSGQAGAFPEPGVIFASAPASHHELASGAAGSKSRRPLETVSPLADKINLTVDLRFSKGGEGALAEVINKTDGGVILVCWQHEDIKAIADALMGTATAPGGWPEDRFNVVFRLERDDQGEAWRFKQFSPRLLKGDSEADI